MSPLIVQILESPNYLQEIASGVELLSAGKLIVLPTETVYGIAGLISHPEARSALREMRKAPANVPFTIHIARPEDGLAFLGETSEFSRRMMRKLWPGPVGLSFDVAQSYRQRVAEQWKLEENDLYEGSSITLRCPDHPIFHDVVSGIDQPLALVAIAGNDPFTADSRAGLSRVEKIFDAGPTRFAKPSTLVRVKENGYEIVRAGIYDDRIIDRMLKTTILFVCSGNTCRSPMAEAIAKRYLADKFQIRPDELEDKGISVTSAGSYAVAGSRAAPQAVDAVRDTGVDLSRHRSRPLTIELIHQADQIYAMGRGHANAIAAMVPSAANKISTLDPQRDIEDPIGGDISLYQEVAGQIKVLIQQRLRAYPDHP